MQNDPIRGHTLRWTFDDGPMRGKSFEHVFATDGSVTYAIDGSAKSTRENHYEVEPISGQIYAVSYLASSGWTLTVVLDFGTGGAVGFASNDRQLVVQHGHFEAVRRAA